MNKPNRCRILNSASIAQVSELSSDDESALVFKSAEPIIQILEDEEANNEYVPNCQEHVPLLPAMAPGFTGELNTQIYRAMSLCNAKITQQPGMFLADHADVTSYLEIICRDDYQPINSTQRDFIKEIKSPSLNCADAWSGVFHKMLKGVHHFY